MSSTLMQRLEFVRRGMYAAEKDDYGQLFADTQEALAAKDAEIAALKADVERLKGERFAPCGDNHHNAALCPHCGEPLRKALARVKELEADRLWLTMRGTDERPEYGKPPLTPEQILQYLRAQRRTERERAEKAEARVKEQDAELAAFKAENARLIREWDEARAEVERLRANHASVLSDLQKVASNWKHLRDVELKRAEKAEAREAVQRPVVRAAKAWWWNGLARDKWATPDALRPINTDLAKLAEAVIAMKTKEAPDE